MSPNVSETATTRATLANPHERPRPDIDRRPIVVCISYYQHRAKNL